MLGIASSVAARYPVNGFCFMRGPPVLVTHVQVQLQHPEGLGKGDNSKPEYMQTFFSCRKMGPSITYISHFLPVVPKQMGLTL